MERIRRPSVPTVPQVAHAETILLTQTMLPMAPPITCIATINIAGSPRRIAAANCSVENNVFYTVAEPEIKAPITPMSGDTTM